jgi:N-acetylneuraminic acid mutarotase
MRNKREYIRRAAVLIPAVAVLITCAAPSLTSSGVASAHASAPSWSYTGSLNTPRTSHFTATLLPNGKVLVTGGNNARAGLFPHPASAELYDPSTGAWSPTGDLNVPRSWHSATLLQNGKVLVAGGLQYDGSNPSGVSSSAELYDPAAGTWSLTGNLNVARTGHSATLLPDGKVLVAGDYYSTDDAELYDPATGTWSYTGSLNTARVGHTATLLPNGKVLVAGGQQGDGELLGLRSSELYDPNTGTWDLTGRLNVARSAHTATLLPNGNVLVTGGDGQDFGDITTNSAELYNPATGTWSYTGSLNRARAAHTATLLPNGQVLIAAGFWLGPTLNSAEIYDAATGTWNTTASLNAPRSSHTATLLPNGKVLVVAGVERNNLLQSAELYDSGGGSTVNPIDDPAFFVRQHYLDFLSREPEPAGLQAWLGVLNGCPNPFNTDPNSPSAACDRITVSSAFFRSPEFSLKGFYALRFYKAALGRLPTYAEITADMSGLSGQTPDEVFARRAAFAAAFAERQDFKSLYDPLTNRQYVAALFGRYQLQQIRTEDPHHPEGAAQVTLAAQQLVDALDANALTRAQVLRAVVESDEADGSEYQNAFVAMQYYGYLRRAPEDEGYQAWLRVIRENPNNVRLMINGFVNSTEYALRFRRP